jgi:DNA gyrase subunit B
MNPKTRRLIKIEPDYNPEAVAEKFDLLLGDNLQGRKDHIAKYGKQYIDVADVM